MSCVVGFEETSHCNFVFNRSRVCRSYKHCMSSRVDVDNFKSPTTKRTTIFCDNRSSIALSKNHVFHKKSKHIDTRYHFIRELVNCNEISIEFCRYEDQLKDIITKLFSREIFEFQKENLQFVCYTR